MANDLTAFDAEVWRTQMVTKLDQINVGLGLINRNWDGDLEQAKTIHVRTPGNISLASYTSGTTLSYQDLTPTDEEFTVSSGKYFAIEVDDIDRVQSDVNALEVYTKRAVVAMNNAIDTMIFSTYTSVPAGNQITGASAAALALDNSTSMTTGIYPLITKARAIHRKNNVYGPLGSQWMVVDPDTTTLLLNDTAHFIRATAMGDGVVQYGSLGDAGIRQQAAERPGFIGMIAGYMVYESNNLPVVSGSKYILFGDNDAITYAGKIMNIEALRLQSTFANAVRGLLLHGAFVPTESAKRLVYIKAVA